MIYLSQENPNLLRTKLKLRNMNKFFTFLLLMVISSSISAQTNVSGNQSGTWIYENSPYNVTGNITVPAGEILTIEAGAEVNFQAYYKFTVLGTLNANGTETDSIFFTADNQSTGWGGISLGQSIGGNVTPADGVSNFSYCKFEFGKTLSGGEYPDIHGGAIRMINSDAVYSNCVFANNTSLPGEGMGGAIYAINTGSSNNPVTMFTDCKFLQNIGYSEGGAIKFTSDFNTEITNCEFIDNTTNYGGGAICFYSVVDSKVINCLFTNNITNYDNGGAVKSLGSGNTISFKNCTMVGNEASGGSGGAAALYYADVDFVNCIAYDNSSQYDDDNVYIDAGGSSATVNYCDMIMPEYNTTGSDNIDTDPLFVDAVNGDYHLQATSPCIDAGTDIGLSFTGTAPDMGCFEYGMPDKITKIKNHLTEIYPNPTNNLLIIQSEKEIKSIVISDLSGKNINSIRFDSNSKKIIDVSDLKNGIYFINILMTDNSVISKKVIILK